MTDLTTLSIADAGRLMASGEITSTALTEAFLARIATVDQKIASYITVTGDLARQDDEGYVYLVDRKNDMLISGGYNVYPREVEDVLMAFDGVVEAAVVGLPDEKWGDLVYAVVAGRPDLDLDALNQYARDKLASYKRPKGLAIWPELPKSAANKILRREVRDRLLADKK